MNSTLDDFLTDECLLLFEEERVACDWETSYVEGVGTVGGPWRSEVVGDVLGALGWVVAGLCYSCCVGDDLGGTSVVSLEATLWSAFGSTGSLDIWEEMLRMELACVPVMHSMRRLTRTGFRCHSEPC
ncbi:hypothetical protein ES702_01085 [subsurface metagenome]